MLSFSQAEVLPTYSNAVLFFARDSEVFKSYIDKQAELSECIAFLNSVGVYVGLDQVVDDESFLVEDFARLMGQVELILSGEAERGAMGVLLPKGVASWVEYCNLNGVRFREGYELFCSCFT